MKGVTRWVVIALVVLHGLIHFLGAAKGFGWANVSQLKKPISPALGVCWFVSGSLVVIAGVLLAGGVGWWWVVGATAAVASQAVIFTSWDDAKMGSIVNVVLLAAAIYDSIQSDS